MVAGTGIGNTAGFVSLADAGAPRIISGRARASIISGGVFVFGSGADNVVSSGLNSLVNSDLLFAKDASGLQFNGIAIQTTGSNEPIGVMTEGMVILQASATILSGEKVTCDGNNAVLPLGSVLNSLAKGPSLAIGRAVTAAGSEGFCVVEIGR